MTPDPSTPGFEPLNLPDALAQNDLIRGRYFYSFPRTLFERLLSFIGEEAIDPELIQLEHAVTDLCGENETLCGLFDGRPLNYPYLKLQATDINAVVASFSPEDLKAVFGDVLPKPAEIDLDQAAFAKSFSRAKAYCRWLLVDSMFLVELADFIHTNDVSVKRFGLHDIAHPDVRRNPSRKVPAKERAYASAFRNLMSRWALQGMQGPQLPDPLPTTPGGERVASLQDVAEATSQTVQISLADCPDLKSLRKHHEEKLLRENPHLAGWIRATSVSQTSRRTIESWSEQFLVCHYYRLVMQRYGELLSGRKTELLYHIAQYLNPKLSEETARHRSKTYSKLTAKVDAQLRKSTSASAF